MKPAFIASMEARYAPWKSMSASDHGPGTTTTGLIAPSSLVTGLSCTGRLAALLAAPSSPTPNTTASWVLSDAVMWIVSTCGWSVRCLPASIPPYTTRTKPSRTKGVSDRSTKGPRCSLTGFILMTQTSPSTNSLCSASEGPEAEKLPAASTKQTVPESGGSL